MAHKSKRPLYLAWLTYISGNVQGTRSKTNYDGCKLSENTRAIFRNKEIAILLKRKAYDTKSNIRYRNLEPHEKIMFKLWTMQHACERNEIEIKIIKSSTSPTGTPRGRTRNRGRQKAGRRENCKPSTKRETRPGRVGKPGAGQIPDGWIIQ